jgi:hypothetical protein
MSEAKRCTKCKETKPLDLFHKHPTTKDGRTSRCRQCRSDAAKQRAKNMTPEEKERRSVARAQTRKQRLENMSPKEKELHKSANADRAQRFRDRQLQDGPRLAAYRAGMRKDRCAICATPIDGEGICGPCRTCCTLLGGTEGLKKAARAWRYLNPNE